MRGRDSSCAPKPMASGAIVTKPASASSWAYTLGDRVEIALYDPGHVFTSEMRAHAYAFLRDRC